MHVVTECLDSASLHNIWQYYYFVSAATFLWLIRCLHFECRQAYKEALGVEHLHSSRRLAKSPGCVWSLQRPSASPGCPISWLASSWRTATVTKCGIHGWFLVQPRPCHTSTRVSTQSSTDSCGNLSACHSFRLYQDVYNVYFVHCRRG